MKSGYVTMLTVSGYFDFDDYTTPIKTRINDLDVITFVSSFYQSYQLNIQQNEILVSDNMIYQDRYQSEKFYAVKDPKFRLYNSQSSGQLVFISISLSHESEQYERAVYTFLDMFGYLGGLFDFLYFIGYL